jgi:hypothetical protein
LPVRWCDNDWPTTRTLILDALRLFDSLSMSVTNMSFARLNCPTKHYTSTSWLERHLRCSNSDPGLLHPFTTVQLLPWHFANYLGRYRTLHCIEFRWTPPAAMPSSCSTWMLARPITC